MRRRRGRPPGQFPRGSAAYRERERERKRHQYRRLHGIPLDAPVKRVGRHCSWKEPEWQCRRCRAPRAVGHELCAEHLALVHGTVATSREDSGRNSRRAPEFSHGDLGRSAGAG